MISVISSLSGYHVVAVHLKINAELKRSLQTISKQMLY